MRILIYEHLCSTGGMQPGIPAPPSLLREGKAMLEALISDFASLPDCEICLPLPAIEDCRLPSSVEVLASSANSGHLPSEWFRGLDAALIVAPELGNLLEQFTHQLESVPLFNLGSNSAAVRIAGDKWLTFQILQRNSIPTIPTWFLSSEESEGDTFASLRTSLPTNAPVIIKPRWGAGSQELSCWRSLPSRQELIQLQNSSSWLQNMLIQPFVTGRMLSVGVFCGGDGVTCLSLPVTDQLLSPPQSFEYTGGIVPSVSLRGISHLADRVRLRAEQACRAIPGLRGYVGVDLILPAQSDDPLICEINPRLSTSYLGYRALSRTNLAAFWLDPAHARVDMQSEPLRFSCEGEIEVLN